MTVRLPTIIVTGASGLVGRHFLEAVKDDYLIYGLARRSQKGANIPEHPNIKWLQVDIANRPALEGVAELIGEQGPVDFILHLAGYYDFTYKDNPEYERTNVGGTRNMLEIARKLDVRRFLFASSLAACSFPAAGERVTERTPPDADFDYARSKKAGEALLEEYSVHVPCSVIRLAAVVSDWCEYAPLYFFLSTWLSSNWNARMLGGKAETAVTYIHVRDLSKLIQNVFRRSDRLPDYAVYHASPDGSTSHRELYELANRFFYGKIQRPIFVPRALAYPGVLLRALLGRITGNPPFEQPWMMKYMDHKLVVDSRETRRALGWRPAPRDHVLRRVLYMIEKMRSNPVEWRIRNEAVFKKVAVRPNLVLYEELLARKEALQDRIEQRLLSPHRKSRFAYFQRMMAGERKQYISVLYGLLLASIRTVNRSLLLDYIDELAPTRFSDGAKPSELRNLMFGLNDDLLSEVESDAKLKELKQEAHNYVTLTLQLAADQIDVAYEDFLHREREAGPAIRKPPEPEPEKQPFGDYEGIISELYAFYQLTPQDELSIEDLRQLLAYMASRKKIRSAD